MPKEEGRFQRVTQVAQVNSWGVDQFEMEDLSSKDTFWLGDDFEVQERFNNAVTAAEEVDAAIQDEFSAEIVETAITGSKMTDAEIMQATPATVVKTIPSKVSAKQVLQSELKAKLPSLYSPFNKPLVNKALLAKQVRREKKLLAGPGQKKGINKKVVGGAVAASAALIYFFMKE